MQGLDNASQSAGFHTERIGKTEIVPPTINPRPGLKIRTKLLLLVLSLFTIPWMGYSSVRTMERFLLEGQMEALKLTSQGIASLLEDRENLFSNQGNVAQFLIPLEQLPIALDDPISFESSLAEWAGVLEDLRPYTGNQFFECETSYEPNSFSVKYAAGVHESDYYFLFLVTDDISIFRDPERLSLDHNDQLRLTVERSDNSILRFLFTAAEIGRMSIYEMRDDWRYTTTGEAIRQSVADMVATERGYGIKIKAPLEFIGNARRITFDVIDVDDSVSRNIDSIISTSPDPGAYAVGSIRLISPEPVSYTHLTLPPKA